MSTKILCFLCISMLWACSLDNKSENEISGDAIINTPIKAYGLLSQAYQSLPTAADNYTLLTEDLHPSYLINYAKNTEQYYNWDQQAMIQNTANVWEGYYESLVHLNALLLSEGNFTSTNTEWKYIKGNALLLKAYIYFELLQLYSDRYTPTALGIIPKDNFKVESNNRITQQESVHLITTLLKEGLALVTANPTKQAYFIKVPAAKVIQARVALYTKDFASAELLANEVLQATKPLPATAKAYKDSWTTMTDNAYWLYYNDTNPNSYLYYQDDLGDLLYLNAAFEFAADDIRFEVSQYYHPMKTVGSETIDYPLLGKYKDGQSDKSVRNIVMIRSAEAHFIVLESLIEQLKLQEATTCLNSFLTAVHQPLLNTVESQSTLRLIMQKEKQKEFIGERLNLNDLKRWNTAIERYKKNTTTTIEADDYRWTWPIPNSELRYNSKAQQNRGWPSFN